MFNIHYLYSETLTKGYYFGRHKHEFVELIYIFEGLAKIQIAGTEYVMRPSTYIIIPSGIEHDIRVEETIRQIDLCISGSGFDHYMEYVQDIGSVVGHCFQRLMAEKIGQKPGYETITTGIIHEMLGLTERHLWKKSHPRRKIISSALRIIQEKEGNLSVGDLAQELYVSKDYLRHLFQETTTRSPIRHIIEARIMKAKSLLATPERSIMAVSAECGFETPYYFSRLFKQITGMSPTTYREQVGAELLVTDNEK